MGRRTININQQNVEGKRKNSYLSTITKAPQKTKASATSNHPIDTNLKRKYRIREGDSAMTIKMKKEMVVELYMNIACRYLRMERTAQPTSTNKNNDKQCENTNYFTCHGKVQDFQYICYLVF